MLTEGARETVEYRTQYVFDERSLACFERMLAAS